MIKEKTYINTKWTIEKAIFNSKERIITYIDSNWNKEEYNWHPMEIESRFDNMFFYTSRLKWFNKTLYYKNIPLIELSKWESFKNIFHIWKDFYSIRYNKIQDKLLVYKNNTIIDDNLLLKMWWIQLNSIKLLSIYSSQNVKNSLKSAWIAIYDVSEKWDISYLLNSEKVENFNWEKKNYTFINWKFKDPLEHLKHDDGTDLKLNMHNSWILFDYKWNSFYKYIWESPNDKWSKRFNIIKNYNEILSVDFDEFEKVEFSNIISKRDRINQEYLITLFNWEFYTKFINRDRVLRIKDSNNKLIFTKNLKEDINIEDTNKIKIKWFWLDQNSNIILHITTKSKDLEKDIDLFYLNKKLILKNDTNKNLSLMKNPKLGNFLIIDTNKVKLVKKINKNNTLNKLN